jgi:hypothetical protein
MSIQHRRNPDLYQEQLNRELISTGIGMPQEAYDMMRAYEEMYDVRIDAGWEMGEEGEWWAPDPESGEMILESDWLDYGMYYPEDLR